MAYIIKDPVRDPVGWDADSRHHLLVLRLHLPLTHGSGGEASRDGGDGEEEEGHDIACAVALGASELLCGEREGRYVHRHTCRLSVTNISRRLRIK